LVVVSGRSDRPHRHVARPSPCLARVLHSRNVAFDADHMIERCRLFLIIALGEVVLTTGTALAQAPFGFLTAVTGSLSLLSIVSLWILSSAAPTTS
jgi:low temperature requirement protein LtrA